jgi:hypothetical protein
MRATVLLIAGAMTFAAAAAQAAPKAQGQQLAANSAGRYGVQASYTGPQLEVGYSTGTRRIADCLASFPGYNPKTDRIWSRTGPPQRCKL